MQSTRNDPMDAADTLRHLTSLEEPDQLRALASVVQLLPDREVTRSLMGALFGVLERFPWADGHGLFWGILHALERLDGYELSLVESVRRSPGEFNLLMVQRLRNAGRTAAGGTDLRALLVECAHHASCEQARTAARNYLHHQHGGADR